jgi:hypothetical protein
MAITQAMCSSFKEQLFKGEHDFDVDTFKIALYTSSATLSAATTVYSTSNEVPTGSGYSAGGNTLSGTTVTLSGTTAFVTFSDTTWSASTITARGALIYNSSKSNKAVAVLDFGTDKSSTAANFTIQFPANTSTTALIRIA